MGKRGKRVNEEHDEGRGYGARSLID